MHTSEHSSDVESPFLRSRFEKPLISFDFKFRKLLKVGNLRFIDQSRIKGMLARKGEKHDP